MGRVRVVLAVGLALGLALTPRLAVARAGGGASMGSRGGLTYSAPPSTATAPRGGAPLQRSMTAAPDYSPSPGFAASGYGGSYSGRSALGAGLMGGLIGAGLGGMLLGHGMFGGLGSGMSFIGLLIQLALLFFVGRWLYRTFAHRQPMFAGLAGGLRQAPPGGSGGISQRRAGPPMVTLSDTDYNEFDKLLRAVQAAWSAQDLASLRQLTTPEMLSYFNDQLSELASRGLSNTVTDVHLEKGDLSQAWSEGSRDYATVAMRFSMVDTTRDAQGRVIDGSPTEHQLVAEIWTFLRNRGGRWILSAIQQTR